VVLNILKEIGRKPVTTQTWISGGDFERNVSDLFAGKWLRARDLNQRHRTTVGSA
jgi:hypothetical protein